MNDHLDANEAGDTGEPVDDLDDAFGFDDVVAELAGIATATPPVAVRDGLFGVIAGRPRPVVESMSPPDLYRQRVMAMSGLLDDLQGGDWTRPAAPYDWTVHGLVAHLAVIEEYTLRQLGLTDLPPVPVGDPSATAHLDMGVEAIAEMVVGDPGVTARRWRTAADRVVAHVCNPAFDSTRPSPLHAWRFDAATALVARAFEIWTHADDIRAATGRTLDVPSPAELRTMSSTSVGGLPILLAITGGPPMQPTRVVLTGPGGGTFDLGQAEDGQPTFEHLLVADVVDYCRLAARRLEPAELDGYHEGDERLLEALLHAASAIAV